MEKLFKQTLGIIIFCSISFMAFAQGLLPYQNKSLPLEERLHDLVSRMTLEEKCAQLLHDSPAIPRLGIAEYNWWSEGLHGVARFGRATVFPQPIALAATFDTKLIYRLAVATSDEARAKFNAAQSMENRTQYTGLTFWSPNINIFRDPRWGRGMETWGEDPWLTSQMGVAFVKGMQGDNPYYLKTAACMKHFAVHSGPEGERHNFNAEPPLKDLYETYLPAFEALVKEAHVEATMGAYSALYGQPTCANDLLNHLLREDWGFKGHVVSDCWAIQDFHLRHRVTKTPEESAALAIHKGIDLNCGDTYRALPNAIKQGLVDEKDIDRAVTNIYRTRFKLGFFDAKEDCPYNAIPLSVVGNREHKMLALEAAQKSIVLLKNSLSSKNNMPTLPLSPKIKRLYLLGPHASDVDVLLGNYNGQTGEARTILEGITTKVDLGTRLEYRKGFTYNQENKNSENWAFTDSRGSDAVIAVIGLSTLSEGEEGEAIASDFHSDRKDIALPATQLKYLRELRKTIKDTPLIVVVTGGSPVDLREVYQLSDALLFVWYPGEQGGDALANILFGEVSPSGKLPITFPMDENQLPDYRSYSMEGRTYKYSTVTPMFPFGFGLGYSTIELSNLKIKVLPAYSQKQKSALYLTPTDTLVVSFSVRNPGSVPAEEVIQLYQQTKGAKFRTPRFDLKDFMRIRINPGEESQYSFHIPASRFSDFNMEGHRMLVPGTHKLFVSTSLPIARSLELGTTPWLEGEITVK